MPPKPREKEPEKKITGDKYKLTDAYIVPHWLSEVERICQRAFVSDEKLMQRVTARLIGRGMHKVQLAEKFKRKAPSSIKSLLGSWGEELDRPLTADEQSEADLRFETVRNNRDLLASRIGRPSASRAWRGDPSDCSGNGYRERLASIGKELGILGWLTEPERNPYRRMTRAPIDIDERMRIAEENAAAIMK